MYIFVLIIFLLIIIQLKFSPKIYFVDEGLFLQYIIKGKIGEKETVIKKYYNKWEVKEIFLKKE